MKFLIASDIHGSAYYLKKVLEKFKEEKAEKLVLLGDIYNHGPRNPLPKDYSPMKIAEMLNGIKDNLIVIKGNCDSAVDTMISEFDFIENALIVSGNKTVFLTHGHIYNKDAMPKTKFDAIIYGHFHTGFIENIDVQTISTYKEWEEKTQEVIALNEKFRSDDPTERRVINRLFKRYRTACDRFFEAKNEFYRRIKEELQANLEKKRLLVEKAEQLKNSEEWRSTTDKLIALQKEWKTIGPTTKKYSDAIWERFIAACDHFFARKEANFKDKKVEEQENLRLKLEAIEALKAYELTGNDDEDYSAVRRLSDAYIAVGHVPYKEKDKVYKQYQEALNEKQSKLRSRRRNQELNFKGDRNKLMRQYELLKQQIATYENNIGFFNSSSKKGNNMVLDLERKIQNLKQDLSIIIEQINALDD